MRILITGGIGFIGQHLAKILAQNPQNQLFALDNLHPQVHLRPEAAVAAFPGTTIRGDVAEESAWQKCPQVDAVIHLAAETGTGQSMYEIDRYQRVNVTGTANAAAYAAAHNAALINMSSRAVYGEGPYRCAEGNISYDGSCLEGAPLDSRESDPHYPVSVYGETKSAAEKILQPYAPKIPVTIIRPQNVVGPGQALHNPYTGVLAAFLAMLREEKPLSVYGDGSATRDFVHVKDLARLIVWCLENPPGNSAARVLNCGTGVRTSLIELAQAAIAGSPSKTGKITHVDVHRAGDISHACADMSELRTAGAPEPQYNSREAITEFISWSWDKPGAASQAWEDALEELNERGLTEKADQ